MRLSSYFVVGDWVSSEMLRNWISTLRLKQIVYSLLLITLVLYPNLYLAGKQVISQYRGIDSLVDPENPLVVAFAEEALRDERVQSGEISVEDYVLMSIDYVRDYDLYYNANYWASPAETLQKRAGDCEDSAIVVKSVQEYLGLNNSQIVIQPRHVYIEQNGTIIGGKSTIDSNFQGFIDSVKSMPRLRQVLIILGLFLIWGRKLLPFK